MAPGPATITVINADTPKDILDKLYGKIAT